MAAAPSPPPALNEPAQSFGYLAFDTFPYTTVYFGEIRLGDTPLLDVKLPAGEITLTLINEAEHIRDTFTVTIPKDGRVSKRLKL
jgi:hypothetical protein